MIHNQIAHVDLQPRRVKHLLKILTAGALASVLAGCASLQPLPEDVVRKLATQRWQAVLSGKYDQSYELLSPAYRKLKTKEQYTVALLLASVQWKSAEVVRVECEAIKCVVTVKVVSQIRMPTFYKAPLVSGLEETWVKEDGQWWKLEKL